MDRFGQPWRFGEAVSRFAPKRAGLAGALKANIERRADEVRSTRVVVRAIVEGEQAKEALRAMGLGSGKLAGDIVGGIKDAVARAMTDARAQIGSATDELVGEIKTGATNVKRAIQAEVINVRKEFGDIVGNATDAAEEAVADAKKLAGGG